MVSQLVQLTRKEVMCEKCIRICNAIGVLNSDEGNSVTIVADNADFVGPNSMIYCNGDWTGWDEVTFSGDSVADALEKAVEAKRSCS